MPKARTYTVCASCGGWVYDWKLQRSGGWCDKCNDFINPVLQHSKDKEKPPWRKDGNPTLTPEQELDAIIQKFEAQQGGYKVQVDLQALRDFKGQVVEAIPKKPKREVPQSLALKQAVNKKEQAQKELDTATSAVLLAQKRMERALLAQDEAAARMEEAEFEHAKVLDEYYTRTKPSPLVVPPDPNKEWKAPEVDEAIFEDLEEYQPEERDKLLKFKADMQALAELVNNAYAQYKQSDNLAKPAKEMRNAHLEFLNEPGNDMDVFMMCETHLAAAKIKDVTMAVATDGWKLMATAAMSTGRSTTGTSGGECIAIRSHVAATGYDDLRRKMDKEGYCDPFVGFSAATVHLKGGNVVLVSGYLLPKDGFGGANQARIAAMSAFVKSLTDPWVIMADWNIPYGKMQEKQKRHDRLDTEYKNALNEMIEGDHEDTEDVPYFIPLDLWQNTVKYTHTHFELTEEIKMMDDYLTYDSRETWDAEHHLTKEYGQWITRVEKATLVASRIDETQHDAYMGRAAGLGVRQVRARPTPGRAHLKYAAAEHWSICTTLLTRYLALRRRDSDPRQQRQCAKQFTEEIRVLKELNQDEVFGKNIADDEKKAVYETAPAVKTMGVQDLEEYTHKVERHATIAHARGITIQRQEFVKRAKQIWAKAPGALHRHVKEKVADPDTVMSHKSEFWAGIWTDPVDTRQQLQELLHQLAKEATEEELPDLTVESIDR
ncbi:unnamed protein product, partial [Prorocentrum cordatum]